MASDRVFCDLCDCVYRVCTCASLCIMKITWANLHRVCAMCGQRPLPQCRYKRWTYVRAWNMRLDRSHCGSGRAKIVWKPQKLSPLMGICLEITTKTATKMRCNFLYRCWRTDNLILNSGLMAIRCAEFFYFCKCVTRFVLAWRNDIRIALRLARDTHK